MGQTLTNGIYLPDEGEVRCYDGLASNWTTLDAVVGGYRAHIANENIHITSEERSKWDNGVTQAYVLRYASVSLTALGTVAFSALDNTDNVKIGDKVLDSEGKLFALTAVDTANSTATLSALLIDLSKDSDLSNYYTKPETDTLLSNKATDSDVVHKSGNETINGNKTFASNVNVYNSDSSTDTANIILKNSKAERGSTTNIGEQNISFVDKNNNQLGNIKCITNSSGVSNMFITCNTAGSDAGVRLSRTSTTTYFRAYTDNDCKLGTSDVRWLDVQTYKVNNLEPSSLSLPSGNVSDVIDISSYITALDGTFKSYTVPANGWISIAITGTAIAIVSSSWSDSRLRASSGNVRMLYPVIKNETVSISIAGTTLAYARFIPCQGNV